MVITSNLRFVVSVAKGYQDQGLPLEELIAEGNLGICRAFDRFDPEAGYKFITYAVWWIRQAILQALSEQTNLIRIPNSKQSVVATIEKTKTKMEKELQRSVSYGEVEEKLEDIDFSIFAPYNIIPLEKSFTDEKNNPIRDAIENQKSENPENTFFQESFEQELKEILEEFTPREQQIIKYYHGIGEPRGLTLEEIGYEFGITRERVRQIKEEILKKLRHQKRSTRLQPFLENAFS